MFSNARGVYDMLSELENVSSEKTLKTSRQEILMARILHLTKRRNELRMKLEQIERNDNRLSSCVAKKLMETQWIYRLLGISVVLLDEKTLHVTFMTSRRGIYRESYAAVLLEKFSQENKYCLVRHDFPPCLSLESLSSWLENGFQEFLLQVSFHLYAYGTRCEELNSVKTLFKEQLLDDFVTFLDLSFIKFVLILWNAASKVRYNLEVSLMYEDARETLPSAVCLNPSDVSAFNAEHLLKCKEIFQTKRLSEAVSDVISMLST